MVFSQGCMVDCLDGFCWPLAVSVLSIFFMFISLDSSFSYSFFSLDGSLCGKNKVNKFKLFFHGVVLILTSVQIVKKTNNCFPGEGGNYKGSGNFSVTIFPGYKKTVKKQLFSWRGREL